MRLPKRNSRGPQMDMQREDFLKLCKGPKNGGVCRIHGELSVLHNVGIPTHRTLSTPNRLRIVQDWFPSGTQFEYAGVKCVSRGPGTPRGPGPDRLNSADLLAVARHSNGGLMELRFSIFEVLQLAERNLR